MSPLPARESLPAAKHPEPILLVSVPVRVSASASVSGSASAQLSCVAQSTQSKMRELFGGEDGI